jgi:hypothetical protein
MTNDDDGERIRRAQRATARNSLGGLAAANGPSLALSFVVDDHAP